MRFFCLRTMAGLILVVLLSGCKNNDGSFIIPSPPNSPITSGILTADPGVVETGETSTLSVSLASIPVPPQNLAFNWSVQRGSITGSTDVVIYLAPATPGDDLVSVEVIDVSSPVGTQVLATGNILLTIIPRPTPTPVASPTPPLTPSPGASPTPGGPPTPTPGNTPTPSPR